MKAAIVKEAGKPPIYGDFKDPTPAPGEVLVHVRAAALSHLVKMRASGKHYSATGELPLVPGVDGVGVVADTGQRVYFMMPPPPFGSMAEKVAIKSSHCVPVPDGLDDVTAAALGNPGMSSMGAFKERARLVAGETVLINGATGVAGKLAVQIAKHLGAKKVIATGRDAESLNQLAKSGADVTISLLQPTDSLASAFDREFDRGVDVVIDYLWGPTAELLIAAASRNQRASVPIRYVEIGESSAPTIQLPGSALRSVALQLMGSGLGSISMEKLLAAISDVLQAALPAHLEVETAAFPLSQVETVWADDKGHPRTVFVMS